ncbi:MAG: hypothetical protein RI883_1254 [Bacteroidota bacterium]|jgi:hypothetical protein
MKKNSTLKNINLSKYTAVAGAIIATGAVNSQIVYTDVTPDAVIDKNTVGGFPLDFDGDATVDLGFAVISTNSAGTYSGISYDFQGSYALAGAPVAGNGIMGTSVATGTGTTAGMSFTPTVMNAGDAILTAAPAVFGGAPITSNAAVLGFSYSFNIPAYTSYSADGLGGAFIGAVDKFIGAKFTIGAAVHYGWVRLDVAADASTITIKDHAYNTVADETMNAGQMLNLQNVAIDNKVSIKTQLDQATINVTPDLIGGTFSILNMAGQEVKSVVISDINTTITYEGLKTGIYLLSANFESGSTNRKIYVK